MGWMAGTVVKLPVYDFAQEECRLNGVNHNSANGTVTGTHTGIKPAGYGHGASNFNMEESDIVIQLQDPDYAKHRIYILDELNTRIRRDGGRVDFQNREALFKSLRHVLQDSECDVRLKCIQIICGVIPKFGSDLDKCMKCILPELISNIGEAVVAVRKAVIQTLHVYLKHTRDIHFVLNAVAKYGLENPFPDVIKQSIIAVPVLLTKEFSTANLSRVACALAVKMGGENDSMIFSALQRIETLVGVDTFLMYVEQFPPSVGKMYIEKVSSRPKSNANDQLDMNSNEMSIDGSKFNSPIPKSDAGSYAMGYVNKHKSHSAESVDLKFGILSREMLSKLTDQDHWQVRLKAAQDLKDSVTHLQETSKLVPHIIALISFLCNMLDDSNFKVVLMTLGIFEELVVKLNSDLKPNLKSVVSALTKRFGENQVIRQANMKVMMKLMQTLKPKPVIDAVLESLRHKKSGVREEALSIVIAALLTFPSYEFDLPQLCEYLAPTLGDPKRRVRQASIEAFSVLAQAMGPTKITPLIHAVDKVELNMDDEGVMKAVQARLARRQLPRINEDGMVEFTTPVPSSATTRSASSMALDTEWILKAAGGTGSAKERSYTDPYMELSQPSPTRALPSTGATQDVVPPKRFYSAGRGRSKLPWEEVRDERVENVEILDSNGLNRSHVNSAPSQDTHISRPFLEETPPLPPRQTWSGPEKLWEASRLEKGRQRNTMLGNRSDGLSGSYRQLHLDKVKRESIKSFSGKRTDPVVEDISFGPHSAPITERAGSDPFPIAAAIVSNRSNSKNAEDLWNERRFSYNDRHGGSRRPKDLKVAMKTERRSFSNSWPNGSLGEEMPPTRREVVSNTSKKARAPFLSPASPIPLRPTLARSASNSHTPVTGGGNKEVSPREEIIDWDAEYPDMTSTRSHDSDEEVELNMESLQSVRSSAAKKRALKQAEKGYRRQQSDRSPRTPPELQESGFFSNFSTMNSIVDEAGFDRYGYGMKKGSPKKNTPESPFSTKPRIARGSSGKGSRRESVELHYNKPDSPPDFNPSGGVTFRDNTTADVSIVGHGYNRNGIRERNEVVMDDTLANILSGSGKQANPRERRRQQKGTVLSPLSMASMHHPGRVETDESGAVVADDLAVIVGKGVFGNKLNSVADFTSISSPERFQRSHHDKIADQNSKITGPEIVGQRYRQDVLEDVDSADEDLHVSMSRATINKVKKKQQEQEEKKAERRAEKERRQVEEDKRLKALEEERERIRRDKEAELKKKREIELERERERKQKEQEMQREEREREIQRERDRALRVEAEREKARREEEEFKRQKAEIEREKVEIQKQKWIEEERRRERDLQYERQIKIEQQRLMELEAQSLGLIEDDDDGAIVDELPTMREQNIEGDLSYSSPKFKHKPPPANTAKKKKTKSTSQSPGTKRMSESIAATFPTNNDEGLENVQENPSDELQPLNRPDAALRDALRYMEQSDWDVKVDGLMLVKRLANFHPEEFGPQLHSVVVAVLKEVKNLRSSVSRSAIASLGLMFEGLNVALDKDLDQICKVLLPKAAESNAFIRDDLDKTMTCLVQNATPQRALSAILATGASHKNSMIRKTTAQFLDQIVDRMGPGRILSGVKDVTDKVLPATAKLATDPSQETRYYAKKILSSLMHHEDFDRLVEKHIPAKDLRTVRDIVDNLKIKGLGDLPSESSSAKTRRSNPNSRANSGSNSHAMEKKSQSAKSNGNGTPPGSVKKSKRSSARSEDISEEVSDLCKGLSASDWREKIKAMEQLVELAEMRPDLASQNIIKIFDAFEPRLKDSNSKVHSVAVQTFKRIIPYVAHQLHSVVSVFTPSLVGCLGNKNAMILQTTQDVFDLLLQYVENHHLIQAFASSTRYASPKIKPRMMEVLALLVTSAYSRKQQMVVRNILPVLFDALGNMTSSGAVPGGSGNLRKASQALATSLYEQMGEGLIQHAGSLPQRSKSTLQDLLDMEIR